MNEKKLIVPDEPRTRVNSLQLGADATPMQMLAVAVAQGADIDKLRQLMDLRDRWEAGEARKAFVAAFAAFKAEAISVVRNQTVKDGPLKGKSYAELHAVVDAVTPALSRHGFAHAWKVTKDEKEWIEVTCTLTHIGGHVESVSFGGPPDTGGAKNPIQARASTKTYLERYTLLSILGLSSKDADSDGNTITIKKEAEPEGFGAWADNFEAIADEGKEQFDAAWTKANPKYRRYTVKFEEEWFNGLKNKANRARGKS